MVVNAVDDVVRCLTFTETYEHVHLVPAPFQSSRQFGDVGRHRANRNAMEAFPGEVRDLQGNLVVSERHPRYAQARSSFAHSRLSPITKPPSRKSRPRLASLLLRQKVLKAPASEPLRKHPRGSRRCAACHCRFNADSALAPWQGSAISICPIPTGHASHTALVCLGPPSASYPIAERQRSSYPFAPAISPMLHSIVLVKQVPDTANISGKVMNDDGTVNRSKLPAVFNNEDRVALELALRVRDKYGGKVTALTMGPPRASDVLRECLFMGADAACLISDRKFAGADTLATSYVLARAVRKLEPYDLVFAGRQAIDGDTAQVGPQTAEKLKLPQITYVEEIRAIDDGAVTVRRRIDGGFEILRSRLPALLTVVKGAAETRPFSAKRLLTYKNAKTLTDLEKLADDNSLLYVDKLVDDASAKGLFIRTFTADDLDIEPTRCGLRGSPTRVLKIESVVLAARQRESIPATPEGLRRLVDALHQDHILG